MIFLPGEESCDSADIAVLAPSTRCRGSASPDPPGEQVAPAHARRELITLGRFDQHSSGCAIPGFRDAALVLVAPLECSGGTRPRYAMSWRGLAKRVMSPSSAITVAAATIAIPRSACRARTTGASDQSGSAASISLHTVRMGRPISGEHVV